MSYWHQFTWEAFATLATGLAAVAAATLVGFRQIHISDRQAIIQDTQAHAAIVSDERDYRLRKQEFRLALFDRRYQLVEEFRGIWTEWTQDGALSSEKWEALRIVLQKARILFSSELCSDTEAALFDTEREIRFRRRSEDGLRNKAESRDWLEKSFLEADKVNVVMPGLLESMIGETLISEPQ